MSRTTVLGLLVLVHACAHPQEPGTTLSPTVEGTPEPEPPPPSEGVRTWTPRDGDRVTDWFAQDRALHLLRAPIESLPQTRRFDFSRESLVAVWGQPDPDAPLVAVTGPEVEAPITVIWHPIWVAQGCVGRLAGHEVFRTSVPTEGLWILQRDAVYALPRPDAQVMVAMVIVEVPCPKDARELLDRPIPPEAIPAAMTRDRPHPPTYVLRDRPDDATGLDGVDFSRESLVVGTAEPLRLPLRPIVPPAHAVTRQRVAVYSARYPVLTCAKKIRCEREAGAEKCELDYDHQRRELRAALARVPNDGKTPIVRWDSGDVVRDPQCKRQPGTFVIRSAGDPRAPQGAEIEYSREMLVGFDIGTSDVIPTTVVAPVAAVEQKGALVVTVDVPIQQVFDVSGCEGARQRPCDPIARPTGETRVRADWVQYVSAMLYRVPRSDRALEVRFRVPARPAP